MNLLTVMVQLLALTIFAAPVEASQPIVIVDVPTVNPAPVAVIKAPTIEVVLKKPVVKPVIRDSRKTGSEDCSAYSDLISGYDWPVRIAMQICRDESHGIPTKINWNDKHRNAKGEIICISSQGLFQVGCIWPKKFGYTLDDLLIPEKNVAIAYKIWKQGGFEPWSTYNP